MTGTKNLQAQYAGNIMYISAIFLTKLSSLYFFVCLTREGSSKRRLIHRSIVVVGIWSVISIIVIALQCQLPHPWVFDPGQCINVVRYLHAFRFMPSNLTCFSTESLLDNQCSSGCVNSGVHWSASCVYSEWSENEGFQEKTDNTSVLAEPFVRLAFCND